MSVHVYITSFGFLLTFASCAFASGRSQEMFDTLNAPTPEWLTLGKPIIVEPGNDIPDNEVVFGTMDGGTTHTGNRVHIPDRGIEIEVDYEIRKRYGTSLSPNKTQLIVNSWGESRIYEIFPDGSHQEAGIILPYVTYDSGPKGFISRWSWGGDNTLIGLSEITDDAGHEVLENRVYVYFTEERILSRLDLSRLGLRSTDGLRVQGVGNDGNHLKISVDGREFTARADLEVPPEPMQSGEVRLPGHGSPGKRSPSTAPTRSPGEPAPDRSPFSQPLWLLISLTMVTIGLLLWWWIRKREA